MREKRWRKFFADTTRIVQAAQGYGRERALGDEVERDGRALAPGGHEDDRGLAWGGADRGVGGLCHCFEESCGLRDRECLC